ncbi:MAG: potassium-transporting ATPase subunit KdpA, partial [Steroidobacteraceae bacterium]
MNALLRFELLLGFLIAILAMLAWPLGAYIARVMQGEPHVPARLAGGLERGLYRLCGVEAGEEMAWPRYAFALLVFNTGGALLVYALQRLQALLPLNPRKFTAVGADSAFNTAVSFVTNTNWQGYAGESTLGYATQMAGLVVQNFLSAATGIAVAMALVRGFARATTRNIGNFWVDVTRATLYLLLPLSFVFALVLAG